MFLETGCQRVAQRLSLWRGASLEPSRYVGVDEVSFEEIRAPFRKGVLAGPNMRDAKPLSLQRADQRQAPFRDTYTYYWSGAGSQAATIASFGNRRTSLPVRRSMMRPKQPVNSAHTRRKDPRSANPIWPPSMSWDAPFS